MIMYPTLFPIIEGEKVRRILSSCTLGSQYEKVHTVPNSRIETLEL